MKAKTVFSILLVFAITFMAFSQKDQYPSYLPVEWRVPAAADFKPDSGWEYLALEGNEKPYFETGDFNGDNLTDEAWMLIRKEIAVWGLFIFLQNSDGSYTQHLLGGRGPIGENQMHIANCDISDCMILRVGKGESLCHFDDNLNITDQIVTDYDVLAFGVYEVGEAQLIYYSQKDQKFYFWWSCLSEGD
jgi:hypothetical protein